jgi:hypothetical protein
MFQRINKLFAGFTNKANSQSDTPVQASAPKYSVHRLKARGDVLHASGPLLVQGPNQTTLVDLGGVTGFGVDDASLWVISNDDTEKRSVLVCASADDALDVYKMVLSRLTGSRSTAVPPMAASSSTGTSWFKRIVVGAGWLLVAMGMLIAWALATSTGTGSQQMLSANASPIGHSSAQGVRSHQMREPTLEELAAGAAYTPNIRVTPPEVEMPTLSCAPK